MTHTAILDGREIQSGHPMETRSGKFYVFERIVQGTNLNIPALVAVREALGTGETVLREMYHVDFPGLEVRSR